MMSNALVLSQTARLGRGGQWGCITLLICIKDTAYTFPKVTSMPHMF